MDSEIPATIVESVRKGIVRLDEKGPKDWRDRIDLETFNIAELDTCILGQLFGDYTTGLSRLGLYASEGEGMEYGFSLGVSGPWSDLQEAWIQEAKLS